MEVNLKFYTLPYLLFALDDVTKINQDSFVMLLLELCIHAIH